jgi:capsid protein
MSGFYINPDTFHYSRFYNHISNYEQDLGIDSEVQNTYAKGMSRNNPFYMAVKRNYRKGVVGLGFNIQSKTGAKYKIKGKKKKVKFDKEFERVIKKWSKRGNCEITGRYFFEEAQRTMTDEYVTVGGYILRHHKSKNFEFGYKFEIIPLSQIDTSKHDFNNRTFNGFEVNKNGEIVFIHIFTDPTHNESIRIPYSELTISINKLFDPMQYSGVSPLVAVFEAIEYIDEYKGTQMEGANKRNRLPIIIHTPMFKAMLEQSAKEYAEAMSKQGKIVPAKPTYEMLNQMFQMLRLDNKKIKDDFAYVDRDELVTETGKAVENIYDYMFRNESRGASAGVGLSSSSTVGEMASSYNATLKAGADEADVYAITAQELVESSLRNMLEVYLLNEVVAKGIITPPNYWENPDKYRNLLFLREDRRHIDPVKTSKALTENIIVNETMTMQEALGKMGKDYEEYLKEKEQWEIKVHKQRIKIEKKKLKDYKKLQKQYKKMGLEYSIPANEKSSVASASFITDLDLGDNE